jgi:hypothetical protein
MLERDWFRSSGLPDMKRSWGPKSSQSGQVSCRNHPLLDEVVERALHVSPSRGKWVPGSDFFG